MEADPAVVNLNGFETFFAERRPFFVEGSGNFSFDLDCSDGSCTGLFYSRRIGRHAASRRQRARWRVRGAAGEYDHPRCREADGPDWQVLDRRAQRGHRRRGRAPRSGPALTRSTSPVEPATNYSILRVNREFTNQSRFGFMVTSTNRSLPDELKSVPGSAVTGGVDGDWRLHHGGYSLSGHWAGSLVHGTAGAIADLQQNYVHAFARPDAQHVTFDPQRTQLGGHAGGLSFNKITGRKVHFMSNVNYKTPGFETNDLGYLQRADDISIGNWLQLIHDVPGRHVRSFRINFNEGATWNFDHDRRFSGGNINAHWELTNNWSFGSGFNINSQGFDDRLTRGGPGGYVAGNVNQWGYLNSDDRKFASASMFFNWGRVRDGSWFWGVSPGLSVRPSSAIEARLGIDLSRNLTETQWVENLTSGPDAHYVFGRLDQTTIGISMRLNYTLTSRLSLQLYGTAVRLDRRVHEFPGAREWPRGALRRPVCAVCLRRAAGLQLPLVPCDERAAMGISSGLDAFRRLAAGTRGHHLAGAIRVRTRLWSGVDRAGDEHFSGEVQSLAQFLGSGVSHPLKWRS